MDLHLILSIVCNTMNQTVDRVAGRGRYPDLVDARSVFYQIARAEGHRVRAIAKAVNRDRTTVIKAEDPFWNYFETSKAFRATFAKCKLAVAKAEHEQD